MRYLSENEVESFLIKEYEDDIYFLIICDYKNSLAEDEDLFLEYDGLFYYFEDINNITALNLENPGKSRKQEIGKDEILFSFGFFAESYIKDKNRKELIEEII